MHLYAKFLNINKIKRNTDFECGIIRIQIYLYVHILCITQHHHHTLLIFVILIFIASAVQNILPFFAMIGAHIFMGSGADAKHNIAVSARHGVYRYWEYLLFQFYFQNIYENIL